MRDYTVPHTKAEDFREKLLNFSVLWPLVVAFLGIVFGFWSHKYNQVVEFFPLFKSTLFGIFSMVPITFLWALVVYPEMRDCHPEYNDLKFYWQYIISINAVPLMIIGVAIFLAFGGCK